MPGPETRRAQARRHFREPDSYGLVLALLITVFFLVALGGHGRWLRPVVTVLLVLTLHLALHTARAGRRAQQLGWVVGAVAIVVVTLQEVWSTWDGRAVSYFAMGTLVVMSPYFVLRRILTHDRVTIETILGAVCLYVMLGLTFSFLYGALAALHGPGAFEGGTADADTLLYFSFVTMTTVGYGDVTAATEVIRTVSILEALLGQIFLVTLVARLVTMFGQPLPPPTRRKDRAADEPDGAAGASGA